MLDYSIKLPDGILVLTPSAPLTKEDFGGVASVVDNYLADHPRLRGVLIRAKSFPGWEGFAGFAAHMRFVRDHHRDIERLALVTDSHLAGVAELLGKHFTSAEVRHFAFAEDEKAMAWLMEPVKV